MLIAFFTGACPSTANTRNMQQPTPAQAKDQRFLGQVKMSLPVYFAAGALFVLLGVTYAVFGVRCLKAELPVEELAKSFDRPVARMALVFTSNDQEFRALPDKSERESQLVDMLLIQSKWLAHLIVLVFRVTLSSMLLIIGLVLINTAGVRWQFLKLIGRMKDPAK